MVELSSAVLGILVKDAPDPLNVLAVTVPEKAPAPVTEIPPVVVFNLSVLEQNNLT